MKALLSKSSGGPESLVLEDIAAPTPGKGELLIDVKAAAVNFPDALVIQDLYQIRPPRPFAPGGEISGVVELLGEDVSGFKVGDRVLASTGWGGFAEKAVASAAGTFKIPDAMPFDEAASLMVTYGTSYYALKERALIKPGESLLVLGAAGGVGIAAVQLGKAMGAKVIAAASSQERVDFAKGMGADVGLVYPRILDKDGQKALSEEFKKAGGGGIDVVYDAVGGSYAEPAIRALNWDGRFLVIGFPAGIPKVPLNLALLKSCQIVGVFWGEFAARNPERNIANVEELFDFYSAGKIKPHVSQRYPLERGGDAIRSLMDRAATGKLVVVVDY